MELDVFLNESVYESPFLNPSTENFEVCLNPQSPEENDTPNNQAV